MASPMSVLRAHRGMADRSIMISINLIQSDFLGVVSTPFGVEVRGFCAFITGCFGYVVVVLVRLNGMGFEVGDVVVRRCFGMRR